MAIPTAVNLNVRFCLRARLPRQTSTLNNHIDSTFIQCARPNMSTNQSTGSVPHELRTASEPRQDSLHSVRLSKVTQVNSTIRLLHLTLPRDQPSEKAGEVRQYLLIYLPFICVSLHCTSPIYHLVLERTFNIFPLSHTPDSKRTMLILT